MEPYTEINGEDVLRRVLDFLTRKIEKFENQGEARLARAFLKRKQRIWNRLQKVERGELQEGRKKRRGVSDQDPKRKRRGSST